MRTIELESFSLDGLRLRERPDPVPGPHQVLIRVRSCSLNYRDLMMVLGQYNPRQKLPLVPLSDGAGEVVAIGPGVSTVKVGDRVASVFMQAWTDGRIDRAKAKSTLGGPLDGMLRELAVLDERGVEPIPQHLSFEEAAALPCAGVTAWNALVDSGHIQPGQTVLLQGTGGVSLFALQIAVMAGARAIITSSSDEKLARAKALGAWEGINYRTTPEWDERVRTLTAGEGVDHVVEVGGAGTLERSLRAVRIGGHVALIGVLTGMGTVNPIPILMQHVRVQGIYVGSRAMQHDLGRALETHGQKPIVDRVFAMEEIADALRYLQSGTHFGKVVVRV